MVYEYDIDDNTLYFNSVELPLQSKEENIIGTCSNCNSDVQSVSYHSLDNKTVVAAKCVKCSTLHAILYDDLWNWLGEECVYTSMNSENNDIKDDTCNEIFETRVDNEELLYLRSIPSKKLNAVFSPAEIEAMFSKASEQKYVRQYLYRARKKYSDFHELFDIVINI